MSTRQLFIATLVLSLCLYTQAFQTKRHSARTENACSTRPSTSNASSALSCALRNDKFLLNKRKDTYKLETPISLEGEDKSSPSVALDYQIGTIDQKPAFATVLLPVDEVPKVREHISTLFQDNDSQQKSGKVAQVQTEKGSTVLQKCPGEEICVRTQVINHKEVCVETRCK